MTDEAVLPSVASTAKLNSLEGLEKIKPMAKVKTEPANSYLQFVKEKKFLELSKNATAKLDMNKVRSEWVDLSEAEKVVYREMAAQEKVELGSRYRNRSLNKENFAKSNGGKKKKKSRIGKSLKSKSISRGSLNFESKSSLTAMMTKFKALEVEAKQLEHEVDSLQEEKISKLVDLAGRKARFSIKSEEVTALKDKINNMKKNHNSCRK